MQTWDAIRSRRNVRSFTPRPVPAEDLDRILDAGRRAPSSKNSQPWDFVVVTDRDQLAALSKVWTYAAHVAGSAATVALVISALADERRSVVYYDLGQATMSMMLAATDLGIGTGHSAVGDQDLARRVLGLPSDRTCAYLISMGYPADRPLRPMVRPDRRPLADVVHRGGWAG
jgi:nitroreductase